MGVFEDLIQISDVRDSRTVGIKVYFPRIYKVSSDGTFRLQNFDQMEHSGAEITS